MKRRTKRKMTHRINVPVTSSLYMQTVAVAEQKGQSLADVSREALVFFLSSSATNGIEKATQEIKEN